MSEADKAILQMKCDCAARWSLTAIKRVLDNSTPEGLLRRAGLQDFGLPRIFPGASSATAKTGQSRQSYNEAVLLLWDYPMGGHLLRRICPSLPPSGRRSGPLLPI